MPSSDNGGQTGEGPSYRARPLAPDSLLGGGGGWVWDVAAGQLFADARFAALCDLNPTEAAEGLPTAAFFQGVHPEDRMRVRIAVAGVLHGSETFAKDYRVLSKDGLVHWVSARGRPERDAEGRLLRFSGVLIDITEQKRVEEQLRIAQTAGGVGTFEYVEGFGTAVVSEQFCRLLGLQPTNALPLRTINALSAPGEPPIIGEASASGFLELRIRRPDTGEERWIARRGEHQRDPRSGAPRFLGVIYDITDQKQTEAKLRELARTLEERVEERTQERDRLWSRSRDLFAVVGQDGVYRAVNPAWRELLGYAEDDLIGARFIDQIHPEDAGAVKDRFGQAAGGMAQNDLDVRLKARDGGYRWINWSLLPEGDVLYAIGRDITERRQLEDQLRQSQKMEAVGQLTGGIAHDFNNMLTGIMGGLDIVRRRIASGRADEAQRFIDAAIASAERAAALTHRLLAFSRRQSLDPQPVEVGALLRSMEDLLRRTLSERVQLEVEYAADLWPTLSDPNQLENAILNLAINARDAMPEGGRLTIQTANISLDRAFSEGEHRLEAGDYVMISVSDTGTGMPSEVIAKAFDPFFTTKPIGQGTGLGLSMVYGFVRQSGGDVSIYSEAGVGTTLKLYLPRHKGGSLVEAAAERRARPPKGAGETVLVVEDDASVRLLVVEVLHELGYQALEVADGPAALPVLDSDVHIDLLVTDVGLPAGLNGRQLAEMARQRRPDLPVLFITGYTANAAVRSEFLGAGMQMIVKPFAIDALALKIREMIGT